MEPLLGEYIYCNHLVNSLTEVNPTKNGLLNFTDLV